MMLRPIILALIAAVTGMAGVDPVLLNLVMPDAKVLTGIQVNQTVSSAFGQYMLSQIQLNDPGFQQFITATGFNPARDLQQILAATGDTTVNKNNVLVLGRGAFQAQQIVAAALAAGGSVTQYKGLNIITGPNTSSDAAIAFLDNTTTLIGSLAAVEAGIDRSLSNPSYTGPLAQAAQSASGANSAWFVTQTPLSDFLNGKVSGNLGAVSQNNLLQAVTGASGGVNFGTNSVTVTADAVTTSTQNAQSLVDVLKFLVSMIQTQTGDNPTVTTLANAATFTVNGTVAHISLALSEQQAEQLLMIPAGAKSRPAARKKPAQIQ